MEKYKKPVVSCQNSFNVGITPIMPIVGLSFKGLALIGAMAGLTAGSKNGGSLIDATRTGTLTARKIFA